MKKFIPILLCVLLFSCKEEKIPMARVEMLPEELVGLSADTTFDTIPYLLTEILRDTLYVETLLPDTLVIDTILIDTLWIDTFSVDTFYIDTIRLCANIMYEGGYEYGPTLEEYGFCVNGTDYYPIYTAAELKKEDDYYGTFFYEMTAKNTDVLYVFAYAVNPFGTIYSQTREVRIANHDTR